MAGVMKAASDWQATSVWLSVWERNPRAIAFYTKCGFVDVGTGDFWVGSDRQTDRILVARVQVAETRGSERVPAESGVAEGADGIVRCWWCVGDALYQNYHDREWGRPVADDRRLFEKLSLEGFMSGLSWLTILRKRESFRRAFQSFDIEAVARFNAKSVDRLMRDEGIVRNRAKIEATINNARRCLDLIEEAGSLAAYVWTFEPKAGSRPQALDWPTLKTLGTSAEAAAMSKDLKKRGWSFVGPTTVYSFMEAMGLVNDHVDACALRAEVEQERLRFARPQR